MKKSDLFLVGFIMSGSVIAFVMGILFLQDIKLQKSNFIFSVIFDSAQGLNEGDQVLVKVINVDPSGKVRLSRKALLPGGEEPGSGGQQGNQRNDKSDGEGRPTGRSGPSGRSRPPRTRGNRESERR